MQVIQIDANRPERYCDAHLEVDFLGKTVALDFKPIRLTRMEFRLLAMLAQHVGEIVPRTALLMKVWGYGSEIRTRTLDVHVWRLRKKLSGYSGQIETIFGVGYSLRSCRTESILSRMAVM